MTYFSRTALALSAILGCSVSGVLAQVRELQVAPAQVELEIGGRQTVVVTAYDAAGNAIPGVSFTWAGGENTVALRVDPSVPSFLVIEGVAEGPANITVTAGGATASLQVRVAGASGPSGSGQAAVLNIEPVTIYLFPTEEAELQAVFYRADGQLAARQRVTWQSLYEPAATVTASGKVIGISPGQGVIMAETPSGLSARAAVHVANAELGFATSRMGLAPLSADTIRVVVPGQENRAVSNRQLRFASTNPQVASVTPLGVVNSIRMGQAEIIVQGFGQQVRLPVSVHAPVQTMWASPRDPNLTVPVGGDRPVSVRFESADGRAVEDAAAGWAVGDPAVAVYDDSTGRLMGLTPGSTTLRAVGPAPGPGLVLEFEWKVTVVQGDVRLNVERIGITPGSTYALAATFVDTDGSPLGPAEGMTWRTSNPAVAPVDEQGIVTGAAFGRATVEVVAPWGATRPVEVFVQGEILVSSDRTGNADVYAVDANNVTAMQRITSDLGTEIEAAYSPDRSRIVFISHQGTSSEIMIADADGSNPSQLTTTTLEEGLPGFTPDGQHLVYSVLSPIQGGFVSDIGIMTVSGGDQTILTGGASRRDQPVVSADGSLIAFRTNEAGGRNIFVMGIDGSNARPVTQDESNATNPRWFPDGRLGFISRRRLEGTRNATQVVVVVDLNTGREEQITPLGMTVSEFTVLSNGRLVLVIETRDRDTVVRRLYVQSTNGELNEVPRAVDQESYLTPRSRN